MFIMVDTFSFHLMPASRTMSCKKKKKIQLRIHYHMTRYFKENKTTLVANKPGRYGDDGRYLPWPDRMDGKGWVGARLQRRGDRVNISSPSLPRGHSPRGFSSSSHVFAGDDGFCGGGFSGGFCGEDWVSKRLDSSLEKLYIASSR